MKPQNGYSSLYVQRDSWHYLWKAFRANANSVPGWVRKSVRVPAGIAVRVGPGITVRLHPGMLFAFRPERLSSSPGFPNGIHKVAKVRRWFVRHPRYHVHFTPTSSSWLNLVERLFGEITERCIRRGSHTAVLMLEQALLSYIDERNKDPKPFVWTATADMILGKVDRICQRISNSGH